MVFTARKGFAARAHSYSISSKTLLLYHTEDPHAPIRTTECYGGKKPEEASEMRLGGLAPFLVMFWAAIRILVLLEELMGDLPLHARCSDGKLWVGCLVCCRVQEKNNSLDPCRGPEKLSTTGLEFVSRHGGMMKAHTIILCTPRVSVQQQRWS